MSQESQPAPRPERPAVVWAAFAVLLGIVSLPLFSTVLPPLVDYPNHLARLHLIAEGGNAFYEIRWAPLPDLAADLVVPALASVLPLALAGRLFIVLSFAMTTGGALWLNRLATGRWRLWPLLAFGLLYNRNLLWGFINYVFGLGVAMCGIALWLALDEAPAWRRAIVSSLVAAACFFSHIAAFAIYALAILGVELPPALELARATRWRDAAQRLALAGVQFVVPAVLLFCAQPPGGRQAIDYGAYWRKLDLLFSIFDNYSRPFDIACFALFVVLLGALAWRGRLHLAPRLGAALLVLFAFYLALPTQIFSGAGADRRLPVALFLILIAGAAPCLPRRTALAVGATAALLFAARMATIEAVWRRADAVYTQDIAALDRLPEGARLAVAFPPRAVNAGAIPQLHVATLAVLRRETFVPTIFAFPTQQPLALRPPFAALAAATSSAALWAGFVDGDAAALRQTEPALRDYDFIVFADRNPIEIAPSGCLRPLPSPANFRLFALTHAAGCV